MFMNISRLKRSPVVIIAKKEIKDSLRNRWGMFISIIFLVLSLSVTFAGSAIRGELSLPEISALMSSLSTIAVFIIPLAAMLISYDAFVGEDEAGTLLLLLSYPLTRGQILLGKLLGHGVIMGLTITSAFGFTCILLLFIGNGYKTIDTIILFTQFIGSSIMLAITFILFGYIVSLKATEKAKAVATVLLLWFLFVLIYDLLLLTLLIADLSFISQPMINFLLVLNPTDLYRAMNVSGLDVGGGGLSVFAETGWGIFGLVVAMLSWIIGLMGVSYTIFKKRPL
ncbi:MULTISPECIES: ABC transporter permease subunit [Shewanella]|nr:MULTISPECIES: ABC transporter permease subunit [Shewanella]